MIRIIQWNHRRATRQKSSTHASQIVFNQSQIAHVFISCVFCHFKLIHFDQFPCEFDNISQFNNSFLRFSVFFFLKMCCYLQQNTNFKLQSMPIFKPSTFITFSHVILKFYLVNILGAQFKFQFNWIICYLNP